LKSDAARHVYYRFELRSASEIVIIGDGLELWRGTAVAGAELTEAIERVALQAFLDET
jgi:UDP-2,3-diacylglucosamine pyrophosphatase LpxH